MASSKVQWQRCMELFRNHLNEQQYTTWFAPLRFKSFDAETQELTIFIPSQFFYEYLEANYRRLLYMVFSDYYHQATEESDYHGSRSIRDDFGKSLFGVDYTEQEWNADLNFLLQCEQFYLQMLPTGDKIQPPMENILLRKRKQDMSGNFEQWAEAYFDVLCTEHLDRVIPIKDALDDFRSMSGLKDMTSNSFTRKLRAFASYCSYIEEMNPYDLCTVKPDKGKQNGRVQLNDPTLFDDSYSKTFDLQAAPNGYLALVCRQIHDRTEILRTITTLISSDMKTVSVTGIDPRQQAIGWLYGRWAYVTPATSETAGMRLNYAMTKILDVSPSPVPPPATRARPTSPQHRRAGSKVTPQPPRRR